MKTSIITLLLVASLSVLAADLSPRRYSVADIDTALRSGKVGAEYAERAKKMQDLYVREIRGEKIPFQLFIFSDFRGGYTLLVEAEEKFVVLCTAFGGGFADDFSMVKVGEQAVLHYRYTSGSGRLFEHRAKYVIGSGKPEDTAPRRDITPR